MRPEPFEVGLTDESLAALTDRLAATRWPPVIGADDWVYGVPRAWLEDMAGYWRDEWSWPTIAAEMNCWDHYRVEIDGIPVHYLHAPAKVPDAKPLLLTHGWPWTFWDYRWVIEPLRETFDVYVPSLPGFGFSTPLTTAGVDVARIGELWTTLMTEVLGFDRFAAHGGDWGALVTAQLAHAHADALIGAHLSLTLIPGVSRKAYGPDDYAADEQWKLARNVEAEPLIRSHVAVHSLDPQTLAYGLMDSPIGTAAWLWERRRNWSDCGGDVESVFDREHLCTTAALYWCTGAITSSLRLYHEHFKKPWPLFHNRMPVMEAPTAIAVFPKDVVHMPKSVLEKNSNLKRYTVMPKGGHFAAPEQPELLVDDLRAFFSAL